MGLSEHLGQDNGIEELCEDPPYSVNCEFAELDFRLRPPPPQQPHYCRCDHFVQTGPFRKQVERTLFQGGFLVLD